MSADVEALKAQRSALIQQLAELQANVKPSYSLDGQAFNWDSTINDMLKRIETITNLIAMLEPYEFRTDFRDF